MTLTSIIHQAPSTEAVIRVYKTQFTLNSHASRLLALRPGAQVMVCIDKDAQASGRTRLYIGKVEKNAYRVKPRKSTYRVCSSALCKSIAEALDGYGTYRICPEDYVMNCYDEKFYNIFFKKYD